MRNKLNIIFVLGLFAFLVFRLLLVPVAHHGDLNNNISWGNEAISRGLVNYYEGKDWPYSAPNQPPLYILLFTFMSFLYKNITDISWNLNSKFSFFPSGFIWFWQRWGMEYLVKLPSIISDLGIALVVFKFFKRRDKEKMGFVVSLLWLVNPIIWYNSSVWGQTDAIVNLLGLLSVVYLLNKNIVKSFLFFTLSLLFKGSLLTFAPIILAVALYQKHRFKEWIASVLVSALFVVTICIWFHPQINLPIWLFDLYTKRFFPGEIGSLTANAFNFWWLVDSGKTLDSTVFFGLTARIWGLLILAVSELAMVKFLSKKITDKKILMSLSFVSLVSFLFMTRIHERYLYPFFPYATLLVGFDFMWIIPVIILSMSNLINLYNLFWAPSIPVLEHSLINLPVGNYLAVVNLVIFAFVVFLLVHPDQKG
ncbi:hypothetical protein KW795_00090 [Candidatus Microgenomates bacterium]|nr:hypothetical protein [Candidatus Microgenomates bacterium]